MPLQTATQKKAAATREQKVFFRELMKTDLYALAHHLESGRGRGNLLSPTFHQPLCDYVQTTPYKRNLYLLPRGHFKCESARYARWMRSRVNLAVNKDGLAVTAAHYEEDGPEADIYRIETKSGRFIEVTANHPFLRWGGRWQSLDQGLTIGDWVGTLRRGRFGTVTRPDIAALVGWMLADAHLPSQTLTAYDAGERQRAIALARHCGFDAHVRRNAEGVGILGMRDAWRRWGLLDAKSADKFVPEWVHRGNESTVRAFLHELLRHDGTTRAGRQAGRTVTYSTISPRLASDVQHLLTKFGLHTNLCRLENTGGRLAHMPADYVWYVLTFLDTAAIVLDKPAVLDGPSPTDRFPPEWRHGYNLSRLRNLGIRVDNPYGTSRAKMARVAEALDDATLRTWVASDIGWEPIVEIETLGRQPIVSTEVSGRLGTLTDGDLITHNTSLLTVAKNIQRILNNPQIRILISSNKAENAEAMLAELKGHLIDEYLLWGFPEILDEEPGKRFDKWTNSQVTVKRKRKSKESTIEAIGVSGELTSRHYDHATFDDIVGKENSATRELLMGVIDFLKMAQPLMDPDSTQDYIGTTWHYADVYAWLLEQKAKHGMPLGVYFKPCWEPCPPETVGGQLVPSFGWVKPVFSERFTIAHLLQERSSMGPTGFAAQYLLNPVSADTTILPREHLRTMSRLEFEAVTKDQELWLAMTVDPAITINKWSDFSAVAVGAFDRDNVLYILDLRRGKWRESELVREIYSAYRRFPGIKAIGFEKTGFQRIFMRLFTAEGERTGRFLPIIGLEKDTNKTKQVRIRALEPIWMNGQLVVLDDVPAFADFLEEAERFRTDRESAHDDLLDAVVDLLQVRARPSEPVSPFSHLDGEERARAEFEYTLRQAKPWLTPRALRESWAIKAAHESVVPELAVLGAGRHRDEFFT